MAVANRERANLLSVSEVGVHLWPLENITGEVGFSVRCHISGQAGEVICSVKRSRPRSLGIERTPQTQDAPVAKTGKKGRGRQCGSGEGRSDTVRGRFYWHQLGGRPIPQTETRM